MRMGSPRLLAALMVATQQDSDYLTVLREKRLLAKAADSQHWVSPVKLYSSNKVTASMEKQPVCKADKNGSMNPESR